MTHKKNLLDIIAIVSKHKGSIRNINYVNVNSPITIECELKHVWTTKYDNLRKNSWCPYCAKRIKYSILDAKKIADERNGKCLSTSYIKNSSPLEWECAFGHQWKTSLSSIINGNTWCPQCSSGLYERICREYFEQLLGRKFIKTRPDWMKNRNGHKMELDGYCQELKLAFEHNGLQHYHPTNIYGGSKSYKKIIKHDKLKKKLCAKYGVNLIIIPELFSKTSLSCLKKLIKTECIKYNIKLPSNFDNMEVNLSKVYFPHMGELQTIAKNNDGYCLSEFYSGVFTKYTWRCNLGHEWKRSLVATKTGLWCNVCKKNYSKINKLNEMQVIAKSYGGECLSLTYTRSDNYLKWKCANGHTWNAIPSNIKRGNWCQVCSLNRIRKIKGRNNE